MADAKKPWSDGWTLIDDEEWKRSGGQGTLRKVRRNGSTPPISAVLKMLNNQSDPDRRRRMRREVVALETLDHIGAPKLLDHNTEHFEKTDVRLYAILEFVPGDTLAEYVTRCGALSLEEGGALLLTLLDVVEAYHGVGGGHRDIKPDNIILRDNDTRLPVLIDFGLSFNVDEPSRDDTPDWQQVGNRFLALPEHAPFSSNKRDLRSDITFCVGILFYALTCVHPATLSDETGCLPHQRNNARRLLALGSEPQRQALLTLFDIGFSFQIGQRWQSIESLRGHMQRILDGLPEEGEIAVALADIRTRALPKLGNLATKEALDYVRLRLKNAGSSLVSELGVGFNFEGEEWLTQMDKMSTMIRCGVRQEFDGAITNVVFSIEAVGDELVVAEQRPTGSTPLARIPIQEPNALPELERLAHRCLLEAFQRQRING